MYNQQVMCTGGVQEVTVHTVHTPGHTVLYSLHGYIYYSSPTSGPAQYTHSRLKVTDVNLIVIIYYLSLSLSDITRHPLPTNQSQSKCST